MFTAARNVGVELKITSGYRKPEIQKYLYDFWSDLHGRQPVHEVALPGFSEHQLGTTFDLTDASIQNALVDKRFYTSKGGKWMQANAHLYGFIMSFPEGKELATGYVFEPWHWRYVGTEAATAIYSGKLTFNEFDLASLEVTTEPKIATTTKKGKKK
jgi:D-alanyl-D-alanine carboxypeptidase